MKVWNPATGRVVNDNELDHGNTNHAFFYTKRQGAVVKVVKRKIAFFVEKTRRNFAYFSYIIEGRWQMGTSGVYLTLACGIVLMGAGMVFVLSVLRPKLRMWRTQECAQGQPHA